MTCGYGTHVARHVVGTVGMKFRSTKFPGGGWQAGRDGSSRATACGGYLAGQCF
jgi:hypothetical protein